MARKTRGKSRRKRLTPSWLFVLGYRSDVEAAVPAAETRCNSLPSLPCLPREAFGEGRERSRTGHVGGDQTGARTRM